VVRAFADRHMTAAKTNEVAALDEIAGSGLAKTKGMAS
jgi:hypothetical protein